MWSKITDPRTSKSQVAFEDLYWMQASLNRGLLLCARAAVHSVIMTEVKATPPPRGGGGGQWRRRDH